MANELDAVILKNNVGEELSLLRIPQANLVKGKYNEILADGSLVASAGLGINSLQQLSNMNLYTHVESMGKLIKYKDGSFSSIIKNANGGIASHSGFTKVSGVSISMANPVVPIVLLTSVMIKQQFNEINHKLDSIANELSKVTNMMHAEKLAVLQTIDNRIKAITAQEQISEANLNELTTMANDAQTVYNQYKILLEQENIDKLLKAKGINDKARIQYMMNHIADSDFMYQFKVAFYADSITALVRLTIITSMVKRGENFEIINERINFFQTEYKKSFANNASDYINKIRIPAMNKALDMVTKIDTVSDFTGEAINKVADVASVLPFKATKKLHLKSETFKHESDDKKEAITLAFDQQFEDMTRPVFGERITDIADNVIKDLIEPREIVYAIDDSTQEVRVFVSQ
ncbi:hypothetical protein [Leuconostoc mesenteroides]|uniref:hypothetical protein n=1 Tax=Leuconostoc mesenteroides TaxID=1245 RepID=UPI00235F49F2|nr:hypothetical protein [Leuconostoc mesenteroides]